MDANTDTPFYEPADDLHELYDAALPVGAPGAWIREAIEALQRQEATEAPE